jgi:hypothetical protein
MPNQFDALIPNTKVARRFGVTTRTIFQWTTEPDLNFPEPCFVNGRRYFSEAKLDAWQASRSRRCGAIRAGSPGPRSANNAAEALTYQPA